MFKQRNEQILTLRAHPHHMLIRQLFVGTNSKTYCIIGKHKQ